MNAHGSLRPGPRGRRPARSVSSALTAALLLGGLGACAGAERELEVRDLVRRGEYTQAQQLGRERLADAPGNPERKADLRLAELAVELERGRQASRAGQLEEALRAFDAALAIDPTSRTAQTWHARTLGLLAEAARTRANSAEAAGSLEDAYEDYLEADRLYPSDPTSRAGAARMLLLMNHRDGLGDVYFLNGMRALRELSLPEAEQQFGGSNKQRPADSRTLDKLAEVRTLLADERVRIGEELEAEGLFRAARNEYRLALLYSEDMEAARTALKRTSQEVAVLDLLDEARRLSQRGDFAMASARIERAARLTTLQSEPVEFERSALVEARRRGLYERAREKESDYSYDDAIEIYTELIAETGFYDDAIARRDTLVGYVETAGRLYREAQTASSPEERRNRLRQIQLFWPDYRDVRRQLAPLEGR